MNRAGLLYQRSEATLCLPLKQQQQFSYQTTKFMRSENYIPGIPTQISLPVAKSATMQPCALTCLWLPLALLKQIRLQIQSSSVFIQACISVLMEECAIGGWSNASASSIGMVW
jgi:hypothetical protein